MPERSPALPVGTIPSASPAATAVIAIAVFLAPYITWRFGEILFTFSDAIFLFGALIVIARHQLPLQPFGRLTPYWLVAASLVLLGLSIGSLVNGDPLRLLPTGGQYAFSLVFLPMLLMGTAPRSWLTLARALIGGVVCMETFGIGVYLFQPGGFEEYQRFGPEFITGGGRLSAFLSDANWNAAVIAMTLPFLWFVRKRGQIAPPLFVICTAILATALVLTASVTGAVSTITAGAIFLLVGRAFPSRRLMILAGAAAVVVLIFAPPLPRAFQTRVVPALVQGDINRAGTYSGRMGLVSEAWVMVEDIQFVGMGADEYRKASVDQAPVHNIFLLLWAEGGLIALAGWVGVLVIALIGGIIALPHDRLVAALAFSLTAIFVIFCNAAPHMYARIWTVPLLLALAPAFSIVAVERIFAPNWRRLADTSDWRERRARVP